MSPARSSRTPTSCCCSTAPTCTGAGESERPGEADIIVAKNRSGPTNKVAVSFQGHYSRFIDMPKEF